MPAGTLTNGLTYQFTATDAAKTSYPTYPFQVDVQRQPEQLADQMGTVNVGLSAGEVRTNWTSHAMTSVSGSAGFSLTYRPSNGADPAVPAGWQLSAASRSQWDSLQVQADQSVTLQSKSNGWVTFEKSGTLYAPVLGAGAGAGGGTGEQGTGGIAVVAQNSDGTWTVTDLNQTTTTFTATSQATQPGT